MTNSSKATVVIGAQFGDEGKGKLVDILAAEAELICRYNGGANAGHSIVAGGKLYKLNLIPSGILHPNSKNLLGNGLVIHVPQLFREIEQLDANGIDYKGRILICDRAHMLFGFHQIIDGWQEKSLDKNAIGTTKRGIGPCYMSKAERTGIRFCDIRDWDSFEQKLRALVKESQRKYGQFEYDIEKELAAYKQYRERLLHMLVDGVTMVNRLLQQGKRVLVEGANAHMLDISFGSYPFVTSSHPTIGGACVGLGVPPTRIGEVYGVVKAYLTRVGAGPFPTELHDAVGEHLQSVGHEFGTTTGRRRRCGWVDIVMLLYAHMVNDFTAICLTKLDVLSGLKELKIGVKYELADGTPVDAFPSQLDELAKMHVVYETLPGWSEDISSARKFEDLPVNCQAYVKRLRQLMGCRIRWIGVGPDREHIIELPADF